MEHIFLSPVKKTRRTAKELEKSYSISRNGKEHFRHSTLCLKNQYKYCGVYRGLCAYKRYKKGLKIPKGVIRNRNLKMKRQYNGPKERDKKTSNDLQNTAQKTKDWET